MREGEYFGEIALLDESIPGVPPNRRVATVRALQFSELQSVGKELEAARAKQAEERSSSECINNSALSCWAV